ncbi:MAG: 2-hydroxychromene-2-carboxylate isomerase [Alphaproteobacteria bacterium]|nr:MAG: 2-hydroxychromene-2-carboxylate isomerase [Alphaproteobacteria bacterium]
MPSLVFWFDPASTYSYPAAMRLDAAAAAAGVETVWRPFLLGPIFREQGMATSPFNLFPARGRYMWRDLKRLCDDLAIPFVVPDAATIAGFPRNSLLAARAAIVALREPWGHDFVRAVYRAEFADWRDIADPGVIGELIAGAGGNAAAVLAAAGADATKAELRANTERAAALGLFGAPSFTIGDELFWGNDRLEQALAHARRVAA